MKKTLLILFSLLATLNVSAQIKATTNQALIIHDNSNAKQYFLKEGSTVTIYAYKKKSDKYHFAIVTDDFAQVFYFDKIPFNVEEKKLKKLPNALSNDIKAFISNKNVKIINAKKLERKQEALEGKIHYIVGENNLLYLQGEGKGSISKGDTIFILGHSSYSNTHQYAIYSTKAVGVFKALGNNNAIEAHLNTEYLPSIDDADVQTALSQKGIELEQRQKQIEEQYRKNALSGNLKAVITGTFKTEDNQESPFSHGDTVSVIGFSVKNHTYYYAMFSEKGAGIYVPTLNSNTFKDSNLLKLNQLSSVDSPEVAEVLKKQQLLVDSLYDIVIQEKIRQLAEMTQSLINIYKEHDPILVTDISWTSNSVGGIEVSLNVINCSLQTIKYITFNGYFRNAVGDRCRNEIGGGTIWTGKGIGPIGPRPTSLENFEERMAECAGSYDFDNILFYSRVADTFTLSSVTIQYMNGKTITISGPQMEKRVRYSNPK